MEENVKEPNNLTHIALSVFKDKDGWKACRIRYNPETGEVGKMEPIGHGNERSIANEQFRILAVKERVI